MRTGALRPRRYKTTTITSATIARSADVRQHQRGTAHSASTIASAEPSRRACRGSSSSIQPLSDLTSMQGPLRIPSAWSLEFFEIIEKAR